MRALALAVVLVLAGCPGRHGGDRGGGDDAILVVRCDVADAVVWIDGRYIQEVGAMKGGVFVTPGLHRLEVRHDDHFSHYAEVEVAPRERRVVDVDLAPVLP